MSNEARLRIIIEALNQATDELNSLERDLKSTESAMKDVDRAAEGAGAGVEKSGDSAVNAKAKWDMLKEAAGYIKQGLDVTVIAAANLGDEMGDLAALTGQTVEETSTMAATFELVGIKGNTLTAVLKTLAKDGINLNMRELGSLAEKYQALQDPVEKNRFLFEHFGRAAGDMAEIMGRSRAELDRLTLAAQNSGKVINELNAAAGEELNVNLAIMQQRAEGVGITLGNIAIPTINAAFVGAENLAKGYGAVAVAAALATGAIDQNEASTRAAALAAGDLGAGYDFTKSYAIELANETERLREEHRLLGETTTTTALLLGDWTIAQEDADIAARGLATAMDNENRVAAGLAGGLGELTKQTLFNQAAAGLDSLAALELARTMGLVDEEAYSAATKVEELRQKYDTNRDGAISAAEGAAQYAREIANLAREMGTIPTTISTTISITKIGDENFGGWTEPSGPKKPKEPVGLEEGVKIGGANGLDMIVPPGYPNDSFPVWAQSGERVTITPAGQTTNMGGVTIVIQGVTDQEANARAISRILAEQARELTQSGAYMAG